MRVFLYSCIFNVSIRLQSLGRRRSRYSFTNKFFNGPFPASFFLYICIFDGKHELCIKNYYAWIQTSELWCQKRPVSQLNHNHCPSFFTHYTRDSLPNNKWSLIKQGFNILSNIKNPEQITKHYLNFTRLAKLCQIMVTLPWLANIKIYWMGLTATF